MKNNLYTIAAHLPFADTLAGWMMERWGADPLALSRIWVLLPTRRAARSLREAFLKAADGAPMLLPRIGTLGDVDEDALLTLPQALAQQDPPPEHFACRRLFALAKLVRLQQERLRGETVPMDHALKLASELARLLDECEREEVPVSRMKAIEHGGYALHWQATVEFLDILAEHWPKIAAEQGLISHGAYQSRVLRGLAEAWRRSPPPHPVIAAGTTGSVPATAELLATIADLAEGYIVLPGLDTVSGDDYFDALHEGHPQWGMAQLLKKIERDRHGVQQAGTGPGAREALLREAMRPAELSDTWRDLTLDRNVALAGLTALDCANLQEEATACALLLREVLEMPGKTAALVTHNRGLARRVAGILHRFGVTIDDSAGLPLAETPPASFLRLLLEAAAEGLAPLPLISVLKHPLCRAGMERIECLDAARELERLVLRDLAFSGGIDGLRDRLRAKKDIPPSLHPLLDRLEEAFAPMLGIFADKAATLERCIDAHLHCAELLADDELWNGQAGEMLAACLAEAKSASMLTPLAPEAASYPGIFDELLAGRVVRPEYGMHPRLKILSPMEARMQSFDRVILGGLNEGSWPSAPRADPWFSRPMRAAVGLSSPERRIGLEAHDFTQLAAAPEVYLTRAAKDEGAPTQPSRWLVRLAMLAGGLPGRSDILHWSQALDAPANVTPMARPAARPSLQARPKSLSVTRIDTWMRDPYALYASHILRLAALKPIGREADASDFGIAVHRALEHFVKAHPKKLPDDALPALLGFGREAFRELFAASGMEILWWPRFDRIAEWIIAQSEQRGMERVLAEQEGSVKLGGFELRGIADRIEHYADGGIMIIDYKTGTVPTIKDIERGLSNQLVLLALMAQEGAFAVKGSIAGLEYWQLSGGEEPASITRLKPEKIEGYILAARDGLQDLITRFSNPAFPYRPVPILARAGRYNDYAYLERIKEWA